MLLGGFKVDFESVYELCGPVFALAFGLLQGVVAQRPTTNPKEAQKLHNHALKQPKGQCKNRAAHLVQISSKPTQTDSSQP